MIELAVSLTAFMAGTDFLSFLYIGTAAVLRALGIFAFPAFLSLAVFYGLTFPSAIFLVFFTFYRLTGFYILLASGSVIVLLIYTVYVSCLDWKKIISEQKKPDSITDLKNEEEFQESKIICKIAK